eukprot:CAMPEP_0198512898 /NCGR_PEP_ID=MMETSP1462-20131121/15730_1 /TAXON_ID=1333877 /ORGANISM="Brandtodinium nutriculum, Strain RCC3387" /LENGTH=242 /DNA_ID=CAMNT_0044242311 /DNA_START=96 /DNA_END=822 /DNA_ORIENTATION=+
MAPPLPGAAKGQNEETDTDVTADYDTLDPPVSPKSQSAAFKRGVSAAVGLVFLLAVAVFGFTMAADDYTMSDADAAIHRYRHHKGRKGKYKRPALVLYPTTPVQIGPEQPMYCNGKQLRKGKEGCCAGVPFSLMTTACCGEIPFYFTDLSCCDHGNGTATLYNSRIQNCCDDPAAHNVQIGICVMEDYIPVAAISWAAADGGAARATAAISATSARSTRPTSDRTCGAVRGLAGPCGALRGP